MIYLLWALGDEETRLVIEAAHEFQKMQGPRRPKSAPNATVP
ncbi:hypothetical protein ABZ934_31380 [Streptomyces sp. NPDC046557]